MTMKKTVLFEIYPGGGLHFEALCFGDADGQAAKTEPRLTETDTGGERAKAIPAASLEQRRKATDVIHRRIVNAIHTHNHCEFVLYYFPHDLR